MAKKTAARKDDPFVVHLWKELTEGKILAEKLLADWGLAPETIRKQFRQAARKAMRAALAAIDPPPRPKRRAKVAKRKTKPSGRGKAPTTKARKKRRME